MVRCEGDNDFKEGQQHWRSKQAVKRQDEVVDEKKEMSFRLTL